MTAPRELADLPYAAYLDPFRGSLAPETTLDTVHIDGGTFEEVRAPHSTVMESAVSSASFTGGSLRRTRFTDVWLHSVRWVGADLAETRWLDAELIQNALSGIQIHAAELRRVLFHQCKLDSVNLRGTTLHDVTFADCVLKDVDLYDATLERVTFPGSTLDGLRLSKAHLRDTDFSQASALSLSDGYDALKGATISHAQLLHMAPMLAHTLGIAVKDAR